MEYKMEMLCLDVNMTELFNSTLNALLKRKIKQYVRSSDNDWTDARICDINEVEKDDKYSCDGYININWEPQLKGTFNQRKVKFEYMKTIRFWVRVEYSNV